MTKNLAIGMALALASLSAAAETGFYAGVGVGEFTAKDSIAGIEFKGSDTGIKVFGGYRFNEYGSIEAAYIDAGTADDTVGNVTVETDATAFQASLLWQVPISDRFEAFVRGSVIAWEADNSATNGFILLTESNDGTDLGYGIGAAFHITPHFGLRAEFEGAELDGTDVRSFSVGAVLTF